MTTEQQEKAGPVTVQIGVCSVCHALFMLSGERLTSPCHGADPLAVLATLTLDADSKITGHWGAGAHVILPEAEEEPEPAAAPLEEPPAEEAPGSILQEELEALEPLLEEIWQYLADSDLSGDFVATRLQSMGAEPEAASVAIGRLAAVRELVQSLAPPREAAPVAPAPPEAEDSPENT